MAIDYKNLSNRFGSYKIGFVSLKYTSKHNETAQVLINVGYSYENLKNSDIKLLEEGIEYVPSEKYDAGTFSQAISELLTSLKTPDENRSKGQKDAYIIIANNGCLRWNVNKQVLMVHGTVVKKTVLQEGVYPIVNSSAKTICKNHIKKEYLKTGKIRHYIIENIESITFNGETLEIVAI